MRRGNKPLGCKSRILAILGFGRLLIILSALAEDFWQIRVKYALVCFHESRNYSMANQILAASRVLVQESIAEKFCEAIKANFEAAGKGMGRDTLDKSTEHGPVVDTIQFEKIMGYIEQGKNSAQLLTGGNRIGEEGCFIQPTLFLNPTSDSPIWKEEIFGPVLTVKTFKTEEEAIQLANNTTYGLACTSSLRQVLLICKLLTWLIACIYTTDLTRALRLSGKLQSGVVAINSPFIPEPNTPFGGIKGSGYGHELGRDSLLSYMNTKSIHIK